MATRRGNNEGSISRARNGKYRAMVLVEGHRLTRTFDTKHECKAWIRQILDQVDQGITYSSAQTTLDKYLSEWLSTARSALREKTAPQYEQLIKTYITPSLGKIKLKDLKSEHIDRFYSLMQKSGVGVRTIRINHSVLHRALNQAIKRGLIGRNPADGVTVPRQVQAEMKIWEESEITRFLIAIKGNRNEALFHLALKTGMRQGELLGLKWSDLDWTKGILRVQRQVQRINNKGFLFSEPKTRAGRRSIQLGEFTLQVLREHYKRQGLEKALAGDRWAENDLVFPSSVGTPIDQRNLQRTYASLVKKAGVQKIRFHDLRHTAASVMLNHGIPVIVVSRILGHSRPSITLDIYGHLIHDMQVEAARIMDDAITPLEVSFEMKGAGITTIVAEDNLEIQPFEEGEGGPIGSN